MKTSNITIESAKNTKIFVINADNKVEETTLYDWVMISEDITTTPLGCGARMHHRKNDDGNFEIWSWGINGNNPKYAGETFETEEEADDYLFQLVFDFELAKDDQRSTFYAHSYADIVSECSIL